MKKKFKIDGMHCSSCSILIDGDLEDLAGISRSNTNYAKGQCEVEFDKENINEKIILETIKKTGYSAKLISDS